MRRVIVECGFRAIKRKEGGLHIGIDTKGGYQSGLESSVIFSLEDEVTLREEIIFNA